jgi:hypothetical protein
LFKLIGSHSFYWLGIFVDNLIPGGWSGDLFKAYLLGRDPESDGGKAVSSVVAENRYEAIFILCNMLLGLILLLNESSSYVMDFGLLRIISFVVLRVWLQ